MEMEIEFLGKSFVNDTIGIYLLIQSLNVIVLTSSTFSMYLFVTEYGVMDWYGMSQCSQTWYFLTLVRQNKVTFNRIPDKK